jgi:hypothetical protein
MLQPKLVGNNTQKLHVYAPVLIERRIERNRWDKVLANNKVTTTHLIEIACNSRSASQESPFLLCNPKFRYRVKKSPSLVTVLSPINPLHTLVKTNFFILFFHLLLELLSYLFPSDYNDSTVIMPNTRIREAHISNLSKFTDALAETLVIFCGLSNIS